MIYTHATHFLYLYYTIFTRNASPSRYADVTFPFLFFSVCIPSEFEKNVKTVNTIAGSTNTDARKASVVLPQRRKWESKSRNGLVDEIPEVLARRFQAQNDPPLISSGVLFAIFITMSTSLPLFRKSCATRPAVCTFSNSVQKCLSRVSLVSFFINFSRHWPAFN